MMTCELCHHEIDESEAEVITFRMTVELEDGTDAEVVDHYWACPDCVRLEEIKKLEKDQEPS